MHPRISGANAEEHGASSSGAGTARRLESVERASVEAKAAHAPQHQHPFSMYSLSLGRGKPMLLRKWWSCRNRAGALPKGETRNELVQAAHPLHSGGRSSFWATRGSERIARGGAPDGALCIFGKRW